MRQFFEAYRDDRKVSPLVRQLPWTHHLIILGQSKRPEEREFYLRLAIRERWGKRELERQLRAATFERAILSPARVSPAVAQTHPQALGIFKDSYMVEFLEPLDRDVRKAQEGRSIGVLLCAGKDSEVVEYALSRSLSPALVAECQTQLPDKKVLEAKLHELYALSRSSGRA
jgi:predicted nuclease of restriction endonuclease-like (RecB) superfamily